MDEVRRVREGAWQGRAPAKVNLRLRVFEREGSGYHRLETVFQALELSDTLEVSRSEGPGISLDVAGVPEGAIGPAKENLVFRAADRVLEILGATGDGLPGISLRLQKEIPHGAGLGGGSSDAAAALEGVNSILGNPLRSDDLLRIGKELRADVAFFLSHSPRAIGRGRGDEITPVPPLPRHPVLLGVPSLGISTGWAYGVLAARRALSGESLSAASDPEQPEERDWVEAARAAQNDFEAAIFFHRPELEVLRDALRRAGASIALLSGSGSALFGIFDAEEEAERAAEELGRDFPSVRFLRTHTAME